MGNKKTASHYDRWYAEAMALNATENPLRVPYDIALKEAGQVASFLFKYWEPTAGLPGLERVKARLPKSTGDDIVSLVHGTQEAQTKLLLLVDPVVVDQGERARFLVDELESGQPSAYLGKSGYWILPAWTDGTGGQGGNRTPTVEDG